MSEQILVVGAELTRSPLGSDFVKPSLEKFMTMLPTETVPFTSSAEDAIATAVIGRKTEVQLELCRGVCDPAYVSMLCDRVLPFYEDEFKLTAVPTPDSDNDDEHVNTDTAAKVSKPAWSCLDPFVCSLARALPERVLLSETIPKNVIVPSLVSASEHGLPVFQAILDCLQSRMEHAKELMGEVPAGVNDFLMRLRMCAGIVQNAPQDAHMRMMHAHVQDFSREPLRPQC